MTPAPTSPRPAARQKNLLLVMAYDGTDFCGWQRQKTDPTIQQAIEDTLAVITRQKITLNGSGRTDSGVHAWGQAANFQCRTRLAAQDFCKALNSMLPDSIVIRKCREVPFAFHARFAVLRKTYVYHVHNEPLPKAAGRQYVWHISRPLDTAAMQEAARQLLGTHDFKAFEASGSPRAHTRRTVFRAEVATPEKGLLTLEISADGFLRYMVRNIVGTLVDVGLGKIRVGAFGRILAARDRFQAGITAPPQGLFLKNVEYDPTSLQMDT